MERKSSAFATRQIAFADGGGRDPGEPALVDPGANPDHADPLSCRGRAAAAGGTPGAGDDTLLPPATPFADSDGNGRPDLIDYAISGAPQVAFDAAGSFSEFAPIKPSDPTPR
ncbi:MAG: hypothetical protein R3F11_04285 [Verrucomicrobiales bacterium]